VVFSTSQWRLLEPLPGLRYRASGSPGRGRPPQGLRRRVSDLESDLEDLRNKLNTRDLTGDSPVRWVTRLNLGARGGER
jgi:hypothetical protein